MGEGRQCLRGERCGGTRHVVVEGRHVPCTCLAYDRQRRRFREGGFPDAYLELDAVSCSQNSRIPEPALRTLGAIMCTRPRSLALTSSADVAYWLSLQMALARPVVLTTVTALVDDHFGDGQLQRRLGGSDHGACLRLGHDTPHGWNGQVLAAFVEDRTLHRAPTVVLLERELQRIQGVYTPQALQLLVQRSVSL